MCFRAANGFLDEPISRGSRHCTRRCRTTVAVAQADAFISSPWRYCHRPAGVQVLFADHDHVDRERGAFDRGVDDAAVALGARDVPRNRQILSGLVQLARLLRRPVALGLDGDVVPFLPSLDPPSVLRPRHRQSAGAEENP